MGWLRIVGSLKLSVSLAEHRLFYRTLLQKRFIILRSLAQHCSRAHGSGAREEIAPVHVREETAAVHVREETAPVHVREEIAPLHVIHETAALHVSR